MAALSLVLSLLALASLVIAPPLATLDLPWLLLGTRIVLDDTGRVFLGFSALVWFVATLYARAYLSTDKRRHVFGTFFFVTQVGNLGVCVAGDAVSFYFFFALMTFAAYGLVIHSGKPEARRAANVYLAMAMLGEALLAAGMMMASHAADSLLLAEIVRTPLPAAATVLLIAGFGVKVGVPLLHMWLPLAHPVAPVPASAVLSGVILKAGLLGWLRFLPLGHEAWPMAGLVMIFAGLGGMFGGVLFGLGQRNAKVLLAYSSVSQMGFLSLGVGAGLMQPSAWPALLPAVIFYALHHALAKSALFLGVGVAQAHGSRPWVLAGLALPALALAGAPGTSGLLAKSALKAALDLPPPWPSMIAWLLALAALGTTLLMARLLYIAGRSEGHSAQPSGLAGPWLTLVMSGLVLPWWLSTVAKATTMEALLAASAPLAIGAAIAWWAARRGTRLWAPPPGDILTATGKLLSMSQNPRKSEGG